MKDVLCLWDEKVGLPCAVLRKQQMDELLKWGEVDGQTSSEDMVQLSLMASEAYNKVGYDQWLSVLKARKTRVAQSLLVDEVLGEESAVAGNAHVPLFGSHIKNETTVIIIAMIFSLLVVWGIFMLS